MSNKEHVSSPVDSDPPENVADSVEDPVEGTEDPDTNNEAEDENEQDEKDDEIKLYKSIRLKGYITLFLASFINYDSSQQASDVVSSVAVPATAQQRRFSVAVAVVSLFLSAVALIAHFDRITPLQRLWISMFKPESRCELVIVLFLVIWWSIACGIETTVSGVCGDGKEQYSLYYSTWTCVLCSYWLLERWWVDCKLASFKSFIASWPNRAPGWLCILFFNTFTFVWYMDLWRNHDDLNDGREPSVILFRYVMKLSGCTRSDKWFTGNLMKSGTEYGAF